MKVAVADTHTIITLVEMVYLIERGRIASEALTRLIAVLDDATVTLTEYPVNTAIARAMSQIDRQTIPDMPDRVIVATAHHLNVPVTSRDGKISDSTVTTIW
jgi:PIN domain nuclease of toxin-antitoxin system